MHRYARALIYAGTDRALHAQTVPTVEAGAETGVNG